MATLEVSDTLPHLEEISAAQYFDAHSPPPHLAEHSAAAESFIKHHVNLSRRVVLISSGGTTVPLENQTVRFIDNFSAGTRGATSAEYFLDKGYAVIFLHRQFSLLPYSRHYSHNVNCFLDFMVEEEKTGKVKIEDQYQREMRDVLRKYRYAKDKKLLLLLPFTTVTSYLFMLREIAIKMQPLGSAGLFYLAAAVSDFFVPPSRMVEHKIQSGDLPGPSHGEAERLVKGGVGGKKLVIDLDPVPKFLKKLVEQWAPDSMIVSFKHPESQLETDPSLLLAKARQALDRYCHHLVIGNLLTTRKHEVVFVSKQDDTWIRTNTDDTEIESLIVPEVIERHGAMIAKTVERLRGNGGVVGEVGVGDAVGSPRGEVV
ncbi:putative phosphopantothenoylcysteine synthetase [Ascobolus immersus RN42]|uniref:Putative phosphopantothenoylcysteine synthetase n=1 Tax=Ascobolus immersus RN42 TaxID=1160509 RepID=A0A3N4ICZ5_ASCIM|nr:putative phosphopantothenoylcysteine synthetase [Ascobolus immersus RN42]